MRGPGATDERCDNGGGLNAAVGHERSDRRQLPGHRILVVGPGVGSRNSQSRTIAGAPIPKQSFETNARRRTKRLQMPIRK